MNNIGKPSPSPAIVKNSLNHAEEVESDEVEWSEEVTMPPPKKKSKVSLIKEPLYLSGNYSNSQSGAKASKARIDYSYSQ